MTGRVSYVRDADTIEMGGMAIQLQELAAPEMDEHVKSARKAMIKFMHEFFP